MKKDQICSYYADLQSISNLHIKKLDLDFKIDFSPYPHRLRGGCYNKLSGEGKVWPETLITTLNIVANLLSGKNVALWGLVQSAKTHSQILGCITTCIVKYLKTGIYHHPWFFTPNTKKNIFDQFDFKKNEMLECFGETIIRHGKKSSISINDYLRDARDRRNEYIGDAVDKHIELNRGVSSLCEQKAELEKMLVLSHPTSIKYFDLLQIAASTIEDHGDKIVLDRDEAHYAIADGSVNDQINSGIRNGNLEFKEKIENDKSIYEMIYRGTIQVICTSATNWDTTTMPVAVPVTLNESYCGLDCGYLDEHGNKKTVAGSNNVKIKRPDMLSLIDFDLILKKQISHVVPGMYTKHDTFVKKNKKWGSPYNSWEQYKKHVDDCITSAIVYFLVKNNTKKHRGMLVRFLNNNGLMHDFLNRIEPQLKKYNIKVVRNYDCNYPTVGQLLKAKGVEDDDLYVIFPTGGSRCSDSYPTHCGYGLNLTHESATLVAILQDILGRLSGYFKNPTVVLSFDAYQYIQKYIENGFFPPKKKRISRTSRIAAGNKFININLKENKYAHMLEPMKKWIKKQKPIERKDGTKSIMLGRSAKGNFIKEVIQMPLGKFEKLVGVSLLSETAYDTTKENFVQTAFRQSIHKLESGKDYWGSAVGKCIIVRGKLCRKQWCDLSFDVIADTTAETILLDSSVTKKISERKLA